MPRVKKEKPQTEKDLAALQQQFLDDKTNKKVFDEYFLLLKVYARSLALKEIKSKKIYLPPDRVDEVATEATILLLSQYKREGWVIWGSFAGALRWKVIEALYRDAAEDQIDSLNFPVGEEGGQEMIDIIGRLGGNSLWKLAETDPQICLDKTYDVTMSEVDSVLEEAAEVLPYRLSLLFQVYLLLYLRRPKTRLTLPSFKSFFLDKKSEEAFDFLMLEIRNRVAAHVT